MEEIKLNNLQRVTLVTALKKELEAEEKRYRAAADSDIMEVYRNTGAKSFDISLENDTRKYPIGTASVVTKEGSYEVDDFESFREGATDAGLIDYTFRICPGYEDAVMDALRAAELDGYIQWDARPAKDWAKECVEVAGRLVFKATGEPVEGVCFTPGKTYTMLRTKSLGLINDEVRAFCGLTPMALLEGADNA